jgi:hypothetical protein
MKKYYALLSVLLLCASKQLNAEVGGAIGAPTGGIDPYVTSVGATQFRNAGESSLLATYTITSPGYYKLSADVGHQSNDTTGTYPAVYINSSNVTLDLGGRTLYQSSATGDIDGIKVNNTLHNITIKNGHISNFNRHGIIVNHSCDDLHLENLTLSNCNGPSIYFLGTTTDTQEISNVRIENIHISNTTGGATDFADATGLRIDFGWNFLVTNSIFSRSVSVDNDAFGVRVSGDCRNLVFKNCDASSNEGDSAAGFAFLGTDVSEGCSLINCTANNNYGKEGDEEGFAYGYIFNSILPTTTNAAGAKSAEGFTLENCVAQGNKGAASGHGFFLANADYFYLKNCRALYNHALSGSALLGSVNGGQGFCCYQGIGHVFEGCVANGNVTEEDTGDIVSAGFTADNSDNLIFTNCEANSNNISGHANSIGAGFHLSNDINDCVNCIIKNCKASNHRGTNGYGFFDADTTSTTLVTDCIAFGNTTNYSITYSSGAINTPGQFGPGDLAAITALQPLENLDLTSS